MSPEEDSQRSPRGQGERKPVVSGDVKPRMDEDEDEDDDVQDDDPALQWNINNFVDVPVGQEGIKVVSSWA